MESINYVPAGPVTQDFHRSNAFIRGLMGPVGSSKSSACCIEIFTRACEQKPHNGKRRSRWLVVRNTYPMLKSTTLKTWCEWFPEPIGKMRYDSPITCNINVNLPDKTSVECEVVFIALDRPEEISSKMRGLEITGVWLNEVSEMDEAAMDYATQRVGRYPPRKWGGATWSGVIYDTNPPDTDHWVYKMAEEPDTHTLDKLEKSLKEHGDVKEGQKIFEHFKQPGGLLYQNGEYTPNPKAENIKNLPGEYAYYYRMMVGKDEEWIKVFVLGQYGVVVSGKPCYPEYNDRIHCQEVTPYPDLPLLLGFDYGGTPACVIGQLNKRGQLVILDELCSQGESIESFVDDVLKPHLSLNYKRWFERQFQSKNGYESGVIQAWGDPAGVRGSETDAKTCFMALAEKGIVASPAPTNEIFARHNAVKSFLQKLSGNGQPSFLLSPKCGMLRRGFMGKYCFERVNVTGKNIYRDKPVKNDHSHPHDALQYLAQGCRLADKINHTPREIVYPQLGVV